MTLNSTFKLHNMIRAGLQWFLFKNGVCASNHFESGGFVKSDPSVSHPDIQMQFVPTAMKEAGSSEIIQHGYQVKLSTVLLRKRKSWQPKEKRMDIGKGKTQVSQLVIFCCRDRINFSPETSENRLIG